MSSSLVRKAKKLIVILSFVVVNSLVAAPAGARFDDDMCMEGSEVVPCCTHCFIFCHCSIVE